MPGALVATALADGVGEAEAQSDAAALELGDGETRGEPEILGEGLPEDEWQEVDVAQGEELRVAGAVVATALVDGVGDTEAQLVAARLCVGEDEAVEEPETLGERLPVDEM